MQPVEIHTFQEAIILRARGSELLILAEHVSKLKVRTAAKEFADYFLAEALVNRPARKLFEAWLRKDTSLWARLYKTVQAVEQTADSINTEPVSTAAEATKLTDDAKLNEPKSAPVKKASAPAKKAAGVKADKPAKKVDVKAPGAAKKATKAAAGARKTPVKAAGRSSSGK